MYSLHVSEPKRGPSPTLLAVQGDESANYQPKRCNSPSFLSVSNTGPEVRCSSPTFLALRELESGMDADQQSARYKECKEGEEIQYQGFVNPHKQSRSFRLLQQGLEHGGTEPVAGNYIWTGTSCGESGMIDWKVFWLVQKNYHYPLVSAGQ